MEAPKTIFSFGVSADQQSNDRTSQEEFYKVYLWTVDAKTLQEKDIISSPLYYGVNNTISVKLTLTCTMINDKSNLSVTLECPMTNGNNYSVVISILKKNNLKYKSTLLQEEVKFKTFLLKDFIYKKANGFINGSPEAFRFSVELYTFKLKPASNTKNFNNFLKNDWFSDVTLSVEDKKISAHKILLSKESPVFSAMFETDMEENKENVVIIKDIEFEVVEEMLNFIYNSDFEIKSEEMALSLMVVADRYEMKKLMELCEDCLINTLSNNNSMKYLRLGDYYNAPNLKSEAFKYVIKHAKEITSSDEFKIQLTDLDIDVIAEMMSTLAKTK